MPLDMALLPGSAWETQKRVQEADKYTNHVPLLCLFVSSRIGLFSVFTARG